MVEEAFDQTTTKRGRLNRIVYSSLGLFLIGSAVAVLGAPVKWT